jgi:hypothetical protein
MTTQETQGAREAPGSTNAADAPGESAAAGTYSGWLAKLASVNVACAVIIWLTAWLIFSRGGSGEAIVSVLALAVLVLSVAQFFAGIVGMFRRGSRLAGAMSTLTAPIIWAAGMIPLIGFGAGWGRPLRIRGRQLHPELRRGSDWTAGDRPDASKLSDASRQALAALWLHDAQKEHASVPAFSRISWLLAAVGAPAELVAWSHRAALEEIEHAQKCFALAAGYGGQSWTVEPMPDLLLGGLDARENPLVLLASESIGDGCQLEDFNADVAAACATVCEEPATRAVLEQIAREERSHAEFSWAVLAWTMERDPARVGRVVADRLANIGAIRRPTAVSWNKLRLVAAADPGELLRHGRIPDERWGELWHLRLDATRRRLERMLGACPVELPADAATA